MVLRLLPQAPDPAALDAALLHQVVKTAFGHRRKTLNNTLAAHAETFGLSPEGCAPCWPSWASTCSAGAKP